MRSTHIVNRGIFHALDVFGSTLEFLILPEEEVDAGYCMMIGTIPPGVSVPLHSHPDTESFFLVSGAVQALSQQDKEFEWLDVRRGEFVHVPSNAKHAWRNTSREPASQLITVTPKLGRFFQATARTVLTGASLPPPTPEDLEHFMRVATNYGYWLGNPADNAAIGIAVS